MTHYFEKELLELKSYMIKIEERETERQKERRKEGRNEAECLNQRLNE